MRKPKIKKLKKVEVEWLDACSTSEWVVEEGLPKLARATTIGFLVKETKEAITICGSIGPEQPLVYGDCITIPAPWVVRKI